MHHKPTLRDRQAVDAPLPDGHPQKREPMRPRGAGSEVRGYGITDANAPRVLRAIYSDDADDIGRGPVNVGKALAIVAVLTAGALVLVVALPYLWAKVTGP